MKRKWTVIGMVAVLLASVLTGCGEKYKTDGCFVYEVVITENGEELTEDEYYVRIRELSEYGEKQINLVVPQSIEGYPVKQIGYTNLLGGKTGNWKSDTIEKIYFTEVFQISNTDLFSQFNQLKKMFFLVGTSYYVQYDQLHYFPNKLIFVSRGGKIANTSFYYNYDGAPNEGFYWIDDLDNEKIEVIPPAPEREGYMFGGWYKEPTCINAWNFETDIVPAKEYTEDGEYVYKETCLYAKWQKE